VGLFVVGQLDDASAPVGVEFLVQEAPNLV
jgi:hypothetical protein